MQGHLSKIAMNKVEMLAMLRVAIQSVEIGRKRLLA